MYTNGLLEMCHIRLNSSNLFDTKNKLIIKECSVVALTNLGIVYPTSNRALAVENTSLPL